MAKEKTGFLKDAYELHSPADNIRHYDGWAGSYDDTMVEYQYVAPAAGGGFVGTTHATKRKNFGLRLRYRACRRRTCVFGHE